MPQLHSQRMHAVCCHSLMFPRPPGVGSLEECTSRNSAVNSERVPDGTLSRRDGAARVRHGRHVAPGHDGQRRTGQGDGPRRGTPRAGVQIRRRRAGHAWVRPRHLRAVGRPHARARRLGVRRRPPAGPHRRRADGRPGSSRALARHHDVAGLLRQGAGDVGCRRRRGVDVPAPAVRRRRAGPERHPDAGRQAADRDRAAAVAGPAGRALRGLRRLDVGRPAVPHPAAHRRRQRRRPPPGPRRRQVRRQRPLGGLPARPRPPRRARR